MLYDKLKGNKKLPFHMPGHKRNTKLLGDKLPYEIDITEIDGFDNLHCPEGVIKEIEEKAKKVYNSDNSFLLVNGSTVGILAAISTVLKQGDTVLMARNCHKSVYNAIELVGARAEYILPDTDEFGIFKAVNTSVIETKLKIIKPKLIVLTSPTYEGVCSDIEKITRLAHSYNIPVLLDAAHGAHNISLAKSADIVIMSLHKTLPALTQCAVAHVNSTLVDAKLFRIKLSVFETSSPSYVLMASIDECLSFMSDNELINQSFIKERNALLRSLSPLNKLKAVEYDDLTKLVIFCGESDITGVQLSDMLRNDYNIEVEMSCKDYIVLILTICDDFENYKTLSKALISIDKTLEKRGFSANNQLSLPQKSDIFAKNPAFVELDNCEGKVSAEYIWAYPPGIPLITPNEVISAELIDYIKKNIGCGINIQSTFQLLPKKIYCQS